MDNSFHLGWSGPIIAAIFIAVGGTWAFFANRAFNRKYGTEADKQG